MLVGVENRSVQLFDDPPDTHTTPVGASICLLQGLVLNHVRRGRYQLVYLPLRLESVEAASARAILLPARQT